MACNPGRPGGGRIRCRKSRPVAATCSPTWRCRMPTRRWPRPNWPGGFASILAERKLTQARAAAVLGMDQPKVSALVRGKLDGFSTDRLFRFLNVLGQDVEISSGRDDGTRSRHRPAWSLIDRENWGQAASLFFSQAEPRTGKHADVHTRRLRRTRPGQAP